MAASAVTYNVQEVTSCSVYSVIKIALKSRTSSGPSPRAGAGSYYERDPRLLLYETKGKWNQKNFPALQYTQQLEILATALKVQTPVQLYVVKTELQLMVTPQYPTFICTLIGEA